VNGLWIHHCLVLRSNMGGGVDMVFDFLNGLESNNTV
jgi:hypothetical protein